MVILPAVGLATFVEIDLETNVIIPKVLALGSIILVAEGMGLLKFPCIFIVSAAFLCSI